MKFTPFTCIRKNLASLPGKAYFVNCKGKEHLEKNLVAVPDESSAGADKEECEVDLENGEKDTQEFHLAKHMELHQ